jgi:hypothetical protein
MVPLVGATQVYYKTDYGTPEILFSDWVAPQPEVQSLMNFLQRLSP